MDRTDQPDAVPTRFDFLLGCRYHGHTLCEILLDGEDEFRTRGQVSEACVTKKSEKLRY